MKIRIFSFACSVILVILSSCGGNAQTIKYPLPTHTNIPSAKDSEINILIATEGEVKLKRSEWSDYFPTAFGATIHRGDLIFPSRGAQAVVLCENLHLWTVPSGAPAGLDNGCPPSMEPALTRGESNIGSTRIGSTRPVKVDLSSIPYIISPRRSHVLTTTPTIRWNQVSEATSYNVVVKGGDLMWSDEVEVTEVTYPGQPPLKPGEWYLVIVESNNGRSSQEENIVGLGFSPLNPDDVNRILADIAQLDTLNLSDQAYAYALANLYNANDLLTEAIEILEDLSSKGNTAPSVYRTLGDLYFQLKLFHLAEESYMEAIRLAEQVNDLEGQTASQARLGEVYVRLGKEDSAVELWNQAIAGYKRLGDTTRAKELEEKLSKISLTPESDVTPTSRQNN